MYDVGVNKILGTQEEGLKPLLGTGYNSCVVAEQQTAQHGNSHYGEQIQLAAASLFSHTDQMFQGLAIHVDDSFVKLLLATGLSGFTMCLGIFHQVHK